MCGKRMSNISAALCEWHKWEQGLSVCVCALRQQRLILPAPHNTFPLLLLLFFTLPRWNPFIHGQRAKLPFWVNKSKPFRLSHSDKHLEKWEGRSTESRCVWEEKKTCCQEFRSAKRDPVRFQTICSAWALWLVGLALTTPVQDQQHFHINKLLCQCFIYTHTCGVCVRFPIAGRI